MSEPPEIKEPDVGELKPQPPKVVFETSVEVPERKCEDPVPTPLEKTQEKVVDSEEVLNSSETLDGQQQANIERNSVTSSQDSLINASVQALLEELRLLRSEVGDLRRQTLDRMATVETAVYEG